MEESDSLERKLILLRLETYLLHRVYEDNMALDEVVSSLKDHLETSDESIDAICCPLKRGSDGSPIYNEADSYDAIAVILPGGNPVDALIYCDSPLEKDDMVCFFGHGIKDIQPLVVATYFLYVHSKTPVSFANINAVFWIYHLLVSSCDDCSYVLTHPSYLDLPDDYEHHVSHTQWQVRSAFQETWDEEPLYDSGIVDEKIAHGTPENLLEPGGYLYYYRMRYQDENGNWSAWSDDQFLKSTQIPATDDNDEEDDNGDIEVSEDDQTKCARIVAVDSRFKFAKNEGERIRLTREILQEQGVDLGDRIVVSEYDVCGAVYAISRRAWKIYDDDIFPKAVLELKSMGFSAKDISAQVGRSLKKTKTIMQAEKTDEPQTIKGET